MKHLPDTKQKNSYTATFGEDADYNFFDPFYVNNGNGTITDTVTGLMWQKIDGGEMTIENAYIYCDTLQLAGFSDWRLPDSHELFSIFNHDKTNPALDTSIFTKTLADYWWSNQYQQGDNTRVWVTNAGGGVGSHPKNETLSAGGNKRFHVRAVRYITTPSVVSNHFTDNGDGTITDNFTNLVWTQSPYADSLTWEQALTTAENFSFAGKDDWRLPNIKELQSLNDESLVSPSVNSTFFNVAGNKQYWSATSLPNQTTKAWYLDTHFGITTYALKTAKLLVFFVRGNGQAVTPVIPNPTDSLFEVTISPNPVNQKINLLFPSGITLNNITLFNNTGQCVLRSSQNNIDVSHLAGGWYIINITTNKGTHSNKIIIHH